MRRKQRKSDKILKDFIQIKKAEIRKDVIELCELYRKNILKYSNEPIACEWANECLKLVLKYKITEEEVTYNAENKKDEEDNQF